MHPFHHIYHHRGPSRIIWFIVGAGVATWWHHSSAMREHRAQYFPCVMQQRRVQGQYGERSDFNTAPSPTAGPLRGDGTVGWNQREWEESKEQLKHLQKRAGEAVTIPPTGLLYNRTEFSAAELLRARLAEHRAQREQLRKQQGLDAEEKKDHHKAA
ncbi:hypothetical protein BU15DRAFT_70993 [Melanogaster broomeanus]|nr:hypothetical protein BU15DRAFT_70993 [Melanogaster broomeanus]